MLGFGPRGFRDDLMSPVRFHRILRRGREYGPELFPQNALGPKPPDDPERGLHFICLNANISRQFEFLQNAWINSTKFSGLTGESDPLLGNRQPIPGCPVTSDLPSRKGRNLSASGRHSSSPRRCVFFPELRARYCRSWKRRSPKIRESVEPYRNLRQTQPRRSTDAKGSDLRSGSGGSANFDSKRPIVNTRWFQSDPNAHSSDFPLVLLSGAKDGGKLQFTPTELRVTSTQDAVSIQHYRRANWLGLRVTSIVLREKTAHCLGARSATAALRADYATILISTDHDTDHVVAIFKSRGQSRPLNPTSAVPLSESPPLRELALSCFNIYFNLQKHASALFDQ
jgi:hypothetical protein